VLVLVVVVVAAQEIITLALAAVLVFLVKVLLVVEAHHPVEPDPLAVPVLEVVGHSMVVALVAALTGRAQKAQSELFGPVTHVAFRQLVLGIYK